MANTTTRILFYRVNEACGFLSNFARYPIEIDGRVWPTSEHYFQAQKFSDPAQQEQIRTAPSAMDAARLGRTLPGLRPDWEAVRDDAMLRALRAKFTQHPLLREQLIATGDARLVEHTTNDRYWADAGDGSGRNRVGELLEGVRAELATESANPSR
jgi:N-glycosidase YbiA